MPLSVKQITKVPQCHDKIVMKIVFESSLLNQLINKDLIIWRNVLYLS